MAKLKDKVPFSELAALSAEDLKERIAEEKSRLTRMKFNHTVTPLEDPNVLKDIRREIARLKTALNAK